MNPRALNIMHVLAPANAGGLERVVQALAIGQQQLGHRVTVVPVMEQWSPEHSFGGPLERAGIQIRPIVVSARAYRAERRAMSQLLSEQATDIVHSHGYHTDVMLGDVARRAGVATVSTAHGFTRGPLRNRFYEYIDRIALRRFDGVAAVSQKLADELRASGVPANRIHVVPNAWSRIVPALDRATARRELGLDPGRFVAGWVGRMTHEKGLDILIDSLTHVTDLPMTMCIIGDGPDRPAQEARAKALGMEDRIRWTGLMREAGQYFSAFDLLVLTSRTEGVPMVILEAMAANVPLAVSRVGGIPDVMSKSEGLLIEPERPEAFGAAIRSVIVERDAATQRAAAAHARLEREFSEGPWLRHYDTVYRAAAERSTSRGHARPSLGGGDR